MIGSRQMGGCEQFYRRLVHALAARGAPTLAINRPGSPVSHAIRRHIRQVHVPMRNGWDLLSRWQIKRLLAREKPDIVQTYMGRATRLTRIPSGGGTIHVARLGGYYKIRGYYEHAHAWVGNAKGLCDYLIRQGLPATRVHHIGNFVNPPQATEPEQIRAMRNTLRIPDEAILLFTLGRFIPIKGFDLLLKAFAMVPAKVGHRPVHLMIAGDGPLAADLRRRATHLNLDDRLHWLGWQTNTGPYFQMAHLLVCPSRKEALGNVILEAWNHLVPVISTRTPGPEELITHNQNGLLTPLEDARALASAITDLLKAGTSQWQELAAAGHRKVLLEHSPAAVINAYLALYTSLKAG